MTKTRARRTQREKKILPLIAGIAARTAASSITRGSLSPFVIPQRASAAPSSKKMQGVARSADARPVAAPVAAGMLMRGSNYQFGSAPPRNGQTGVRLTGRQIWAAILSDFTTAGKPFNVAAGTTTSYYTLTFDPDDTVTMFPPLTSLSQAFGRYCLRKARVIFTPAASTSSAVQFTMAAFTDAASVQTHSTPTALGLLENSNSVTGPVWAMSSIDVPCDDELRYTNQTVADASLSAAEERQDHAFGMVGVLSGSSTATSYGYLHIEYTIDFYEVIAQSNEASLLKARRRVEQLERLLSVRLPAKSDEKEEKKERPLVVTDEDYVGLTPPASAKGLSSIPPVLLTRPGGRTASAKA